MAALQPMVLRGPVVSHVVQDQIPLMSMRLDGFFFKQQREFCYIVARVAAPVFLAASDVEGAR